MKGKRLFFCLFIALLVRYADAWGDALPASGALSVVEEVSVAVLMDSLDCAIGRSAAYVAVREERIARLKRQSEADTSALSRFRHNSEIYREYKAYICDSAIRYLNLNLEWAVREDRSEQVRETRLELAYLMASTGMYEEAADVLRQVDRGSLSDRLLADYYDCYRHLYGELGAYTQDASFRKRYRERSACYDDSLMRVLSPLRPLYAERQESRLAAAGDLPGACDVNDARMARTLPDTPEFALVTYHRSLLCRMRGDREGQKRFLALSALTDIRLAITDHASLWNLARLLYEEGDIERAYQYIRFSWSETNRYNARSRSLQTAGILSLIDLTYQALSEKQNLRLRIYIGLISALILLLTVAIGYIYRQMRRLADARNNLERTNEQLHISNHIKEEYLGRFMNLCSIYINRMDDYRRMVNKKVRAGQTEELLKMVHSRETLDSGVRELYENFDTAFLHLFPDFVEKFNELLRPEERIVLRKGELLNTELRIFALIRMGIDDSSQIAEFLRYSVNTIYNYRAKVKNKACISREEFETRLMQIR